MASGLLAEIGRKSDRSALGNRRGHLLPDSQQDGLHGVVAVPLLAIELIEPESKCGLGRYHVPQSHKRA